MESTHLIVLITHHISMHTKSFNCSQNSRTKYTTSSAGSLSHMYTYQPAHQILSKHVL